MLLCGGLGRHKFYDAVHKSKKSLYLFLVFWAKTTTVLYNLLSHFLLITVFYCMGFTLLLAPIMPSNTVSVQSYSELLITIFYSFSKSKCNLHSPKTLFIIRLLYFLIKHFGYQNQPQNIAPKIKNNEQP